MTYCHKCGARLDEDARFCRNCGTPVQEIPVTSSTSVYMPPQRREHKPYRLPTFILIGILLVAALSAITLVPFIPVDSTQSHSIPQTNVSMINLDFDADIADMNVIFREQPNQLIVADVIAKGSVGIFASNPPVEFTLDQETVGQNMTVTGKISRHGIWPFSLDLLRVTCNIYVDYSIIWDLNVQTNVGNIIIDEIKSPVTFQGLRLQATTGNVEVNLANLVTINQDIEVSTTTGNIMFRWNEPQLSDNMAINLRSTTGRVNVEVTQNKAFPGNITLNAQTTTGNVNLDMGISGNVGAQITSQTTTGRITLDVDRFDGAQSPIRSRNYPAASNFEVMLETTTGNVHIAARYLSSSAIDHEITADLNVAYV